MKIALYIEDGIEQIVLTPETEIERGIVGKLTDGSREMSIYNGEFYACRGGWIRHQRQFPDAFYRASEQPDASTIIVLKPKSNKPTDAEA